MSEFDYSEPDYGYGPGVTPDEGYDYEAPEPLDDLSGQLAEVSPQEWEHWQLEQQAQANARESVAQEQEQAMVLDQLAGAAQEVGLSEYDPGAVVTNVEAALHEYMTQAMAAGASAEEAYGLLQAQGPEFGRELLKAAATDQKWENITTDCKNQITSRARENALRANRQGY